jgi:hypothetical protein
MRWNHCDGLYATLTNWFAPVCIIAVGTLLLILLLQLELLLQLSAESLTLATTLSVTPACYNVDTQ